MMGHQLKKPPVLDPVLENCTGPEPVVSLTRQPSVQYKPHKYGAPPEPETRQCLTCVSLPWGFFGKLRDRYIKAMNEMAMGGDFTAVMGFHGLGGAEHDYTLQHCRSVNDRYLEALQEESAAITRSKHQARQL